LKAIQKANEEKAALVYNAIEKAKDFYTCPVDPNYRSTMNIVFTLTNPELDKAFLKGTEDLGMLGLKGHRSVGGFRASLYNAMPLEGAKALAQYMSDFAKKNG